MTTCKACGGRNVERYVTAWVDANAWDSGEPNAEKTEWDEEANLYSATTWCRDCEDHTELVRSDA